MVNWLTSPVSASDTESPNLMSPSGIITKLLSLSLSLYAILKHFVPPQIFGCKQAIRLQSLSGSRIRSRFQVTSNRIGTSFGLLLLRTLRSIFLNIPQIPIRHKSHLSYTRTMCQLQTERQDTRTYGSGGKNTHSTMRLSASGVIWLLEINRTSVEWYG